MKKFKCFLIVFVTFVFLFVHSTLVYASSSQEGNALSSIAVKEAVQASSANITETSSHVTGLDGIYILRNRGNSQVLQNENNNASSEILDYTLQSQLVRVVTFEGNAAMGLAGNTYLIESISNPGYYLQAASYSSTSFGAIVTFPSHTMLWKVALLSNGTYRIYPNSFQTQALCAPMIATAGYNISTEGCNLNNTYMQWDFLPNYSWYSQIGSYFRGWETGTFDYANSDAFALDYLKIESFSIDNIAYSNESILTPINEEGCHLCAVSMILANHDLFTQTNRYDVRSGKNARIFADPYAVAMANLNLSNWNIAADGLIEGNYSEPASIAKSRIDSVFNCQLTKHVFEDGTTVRAKANYILSTMNTKGSVILRFQNHSIVAAATTYTAQTPLESIDYAFYIFDPGTSIATRGCYVQLSETAYSIEEVESIYYLDTNS